MTKKLPRFDQKIKELELKNQTLNTKNQELVLGWQRTQADFENFRKRTVQERLELIKTANIDLTLAIVPVLDNFERALLHKPDLLCHPELVSGSRDSVSGFHPVRNDKEKEELQKIRDYIEGLELIKNQLEQILSQEGLTKIEVKPGDQFDPNFHEAISTEKSGKYQDGQIVEVVENGYEFGEKILKPVKVKVCKNS